MKFRKCKKSSSEKKENKAYVCDNIKHTPPSYSSVFLQREPGNSQCHTYSSSSSSIRSIKRPLNHAKNSSERQHEENSPHKCITPTSLFLIWADPSTRSTARRRSCKRERERKEGAWEKYKGSSLTESNLPGVYTLELRGPLEREKEIKLSHLLYIHTHSEQSGPRPALLIYWDKRRVYTAESQGVPRGVLDSEPLLLDISLYLYLGLSFELYCEVVMIIGFWQAGDFFST